MKIGPLYIAHGENAALLSWHYDWSITWSWLVSLHWHRKPNALGFYKMPIHGGEGVFAGWNNRIFDLHFQSQPTLARDWPFSGRKNRLPPQQ